MTTSHVGERTQRKVTLPSEWIVPDAVGTVLQLRQVLSRPRMRNSSYECIIWLATEEGKDAEWRLGPSSSCNAVSAPTSFAAML